MYKFSIELKKKQKRKIEKKNWISFFLGEPTQIKMKKKEKKKKGNRLLSQSILCFSFEFECCLSRNPTGGRLTRSFIGCHPWRMNPRIHNGHKTKVIWLHHRSSPKLYLPTFSPCQKKKKNSFLFSFQKFFCFVLTTFSKMDAKIFFFKSRVNIFSKLQSAFHFFYYPNKFKKDKKGNYRHPVIMTILFIKFHFFSPNLFQSVFFFFILKQIKKLKLNF